jgi:hypothetical protein
MVLYGVRIVRVKIVKIGTSVIFSDFVSLFHSAALLKTLSQVFSFESLQFMIFYCPD